MQTFDFPYHTFRTEYPESGNRVQLGGNYVFTAPPNGPDLRRFTLKFKTMFYYLYPNGTIDTTKNPQYNMAVLEAFYNAHKLHRSFLYPHPVYGNVEVKFMSPLKIPEGIEGGNGALGDFEIDLIEINQ
jgi:hypothetical protein